MTVQRPLSDQEIHELEALLESGRLRGDERLEGWTRRLLAEVKQKRDSTAPGEPSEQPGSLKAHGDALLDRSGSRHGID
jgi:hypothetical protein